MPLQWSVLSIHWICTLLQLLAWWIQHVCYSIRWIHSTNTCHLKHDVSIHDKKQPVSIPSSRRNINFIQRPYWWPGTKAFIYKTPEQYTSWGPCGINDLCFGTSSGTSLMCKSFHHVNIKNAKTNNLQLFSSYCIMPTKSQQVVTNAGNFLLAALSGQNQHTTPQMPMSSLVDIFQEAIDNLLEECKWQW